MIKNKSDQLLKMAQQSSNAQNSKDFNLLMKQMQEIQNQEIQEEKNQTIQDKIGVLINKLAKESSTTKNHFPLMQLLLDLSPLMDNINQLKDQIKDSDSLTLYMKYRSVIKQFEDNTAECEKISKESLNAAFDPKKMAEIKEKVLNMCQSMKYLQNAAIKQTQKYLLWMDKKASNNYSTLSELQQKYQGMVLVQYYDNDEEFRNDLIKNGDQPTVVMMSGAAAGSNKQYGDGDHFNFLKQNMKNLRIMGTVIYCGQQGYNNLKHLLQDPSKLLKCITTQEQELYECIDKLLVPNDYKRFILLEHIDFFIPTLKKQFLNIGQNNLSQDSLLKLHPQKNQMQSNFQKAKDLIIKKKIPLRKEVIDNILNIPKAIEKCFQGQTSDEQIAKNILRLYSQNEFEFPVYQFLNSTMNILNEELMIYLSDFYFIFCIALYKYNDLNVSYIQSNGTPTKLYRGSSIPVEHFNEFLQQKKTIVLPSFSSFTTNIKAAYPFMLSNSYDGTYQVMFVYTYTCGSGQFPNRPKCICEVSSYPSENEYIVYPFTAFTIVSVEVDTYQGSNYYKINLAIK